MTHQSDIDPPRGMTRRQSLGTLGAGAAAVLAAPAAFAQEGPPPPVNRLDSLL